MSDIVETYTDIARTLTGTGGPFEMAEVQAAGRRLRAYRCAPDSFLDVIEQARGRFGDRLLIHEDGTDFTYEDVISCAFRLATALRDRYGVAAGDRVGVAMRNRREWIVTMFAAMRLGAVAALFNSRGSAGELTAAAADLGCKVIVTDAPRAMRLREGGVATPLLLVPEKGEDARIVGVLRFDEAIQDARAEADGAHVGADQPAWILFTSGTSGRAKGAVLTHRNICNMIANVDFLGACGLQLAAKTYGVPVDALLAKARPPGALLAIPLFHISGLIQLVSIMRGGGFLAIMRRWRAETAADLVFHKKLTLLTAPPLVIEDLLALPDAGEKLSSLLNIAIGGQATAPNIVERVRAALPNAGQSAGWGMTEASGSICAASGPVFMARSASAGMLAPIMDVRVVDEDGRELARGAVGELQARGVLMMASYWNLPEATAEAFDGEWYRTGDIGFVDDNNFIHIVDRKKDMVITSGENIYCVEVESALASMGSFVEVSLFGVPDERLGERAIAALTLREGARATAAEVKAHVGGLLADYKAPAEVVFDLGPFPRNATGKVDKIKLRALYLQRRQTAA